MPLDVRNALGEETAERRIVLRLRGLTSGTERHFHGGRGATSATEHELWYERPGCSSIDRTVLTRPCVDQTVFMDRVDRTVLIGPC